MTTFLFEGYVGLVLLALLVVGWRYLERRVFAALAIGATAWLAYVGVMSYFGVVGNPALRPPGAVYILLPVIALVAFVSRSVVGMRAALVVPAAVVIALQAFRIGVELLLHRLYVDGLVPKLMTYEGGNVDIVIGLSAPLIAWLSTRGRSGMQWALVWNVAGLAALANVAIRAVGTAPGALHVIHSEVPNLAVGMFPFTYLAGLFAPLAVLGHVLAIRSLRSQFKSASASSGAAGWDRLAQARRP